MSKTYTPDSAAQDVEAALRLLEGRWKLVILFHLFGGKILRFSDLERVIPNITQKMLGQQLRRMESDGIVVRKVYPQVSSAPQSGIQSHGVGAVPMPSTRRVPEVGRFTAAAERRTSSRAYREYECVRAKGWQRTKTI